MRFSRITNSMNRTTRNRLYAHSIFGRIELYLRTGGYPIIQLLSRICLLIRYFSNEQNLLKPFRFRPDQEIRNLVRTGKSHPGIKQ